ncbi:MAG: glycoside hydrolase family 88 protein [Luteolibacter sp.]|uniref:glycoside hydrolase family 88/105 protein n=1 Tax=Luteolibacter sp. TaxID=1962973 RepID=UPI0032640580
MIFSKTLITLALSCAAMPAFSAELESWPDSASPLAIGKKLTERFLAMPHTNFGSPKPPSHITYPEVCVWYGALTFAKASHNPDLTKALVARFSPLFGDEAKLVPSPDHVDNTLFGGLACEIAIQSDDKRCLELGKRFADAQWQPTPERSTKFDAITRDRIDHGLSWQTRFWIDDMFMITIAQAQAFRATGEARYIDRAALEMTAYLKELQEPNGLFHHASDVPFFWGRGNGWMAAGTTELLRSLPENHPERPAILAGYRKMMATLLKTQGEDGMWRQLVDDPSSWPETSCTGMFTFAMITGVKNGWLDAPEYGPAARKGWLALTGYIDPNGDVREVCIGTNKENSRDYYLNRPRTTGDLHGQAPILWCATAFLR